MSFRVRPEAAGDVEAIHRVNRLAFGQDVEADLVDALRRNGGLVVSLVAEDDSGEICGHVAFSEVTVTGDQGTFRSMGLAPLAVLPERQRTGAGSQLTRAGLDALRRAGHPVVFVLGHPDYYPRFGFQPAEPRGLRWERPCSPGAFMVLELQPGTLAGRTGVVRYRPEFDAF